jgi:glycerophosphoryl diester phosphodiesterase
MNKATLILGCTMLLSACSNNESGKDAAATTWNTLSGDAPAIIAHRGASAHLPGHTLEAYALGIDQGADYIEPDLVMTKDNVLICRHDRFLSATTDISDHPEFADRKTEKDGREDWWAEDFTLAEIRTLRSRQNQQHRSKAHDDQYAIPTFEEVIELVKRKSDETGRVIGIYPEPKQSAQLAALNKDIGAALVEALQKADWQDADAPVIIQSFEVAVLKMLNEQIDVPLVQLTLSKTYFDENLPHESFIEIASIPEYADGIGPSRRLIVHDDGTVTDLIERAHALGLEVHAWTLMGDQDSPDGLSPEDETRRMFELGVDAVFADDPAQAVRIRAERNSI